jgi:hypothetical protein
MPLSMRPVIENFGSISGTTFYLNNGTTIFPADGENSSNEENNYQTWPLCNFKYNDIISLDNCYYSFDNKKADESTWYKIKHSWYGNVKEFIDLSEDYSLRNAVELPDNNNFQEFYLVDSDGEYLANNGNFLLQAKNIISIMIVNNETSNGRNFIKFRVYKEVENG